jgi:cell division protein FtsW
LIAPANLSTALLTGATSLLLMFIGRVSVKHILATVAIAMIPVAILISVAVFSYSDKADTLDGRNVGVTEKMRSVGRVGTWIKRVQDFIYAKADETPYQMQQSQIAIAKGGVFGLGPGNSEQRISYLILILILSMQLL